MLPHPSVDAVPNLWTVSRGKDRTIEDPPYEIEASGRIRSPSTANPSYQTTAQGSNVTEKDEGGLEEEFYNEMATLYGAKVQPEHHICGVSVNLYSLWKTVNHQFDGVKYVDDCQLWPMVAQISGLSTLEHQYAPWDLRSLYRSSLVRMANSKSLSRNDDCAKTNVGLRTKPHQQHAIQTIGNVHYFRPALPSGLPSIARHAAASIAKPSDARCFDPVTEDWVNMTDSDQTMLMDLNHFLRISNGRGLEGSGITVRGTLVSFPVLYRTVLHCGGYDVVTAERLWGDVGNLLGYPSASAGVVGDPLRQTYQQYLLQYDKWSAHRDSITSDDPSHEQ